MPDKYSTRHPKGDKESSNKDDNGKKSISDRYEDQKERLEEKRARKLEKKANKRASKNRFDLGSFLKRYGYLIGVIIIIIVISQFNQSQAEKNDEIESKMIGVKEEIADKKSDLESLEGGYDEVEFEEEVEESTSNAKSFGEEVIEVDNVLTSHYKKPNLYPNPDDEEQKEQIDKELDKYKKKNTELRGAEDGDHTATWQLNPDWDLKLETLMSYKNTVSFPIVFSMTTSNDENAGIVYGQYDVENNKLSNIKVHYTNAGMDDAASIGGD